MGYEDTRFQQTLTDRTLKLRRNFLIVSCVGIIIAKTGLVPTEITALGLKFSEVNQQDFLWLVAGIIAYYLIAFYVHSICDFCSWLRSKTIDAKSNDIVRSKDTPAFGFSEGFFGFFYALRILFDNILPLPVGYYAFLSLSQAIYVLK